MFVCSVVSLVVCLMSLFVFYVYLLLPTFPSLFLQVYLCEGGLVCLFLSLFVEFYVYLLLYLPVPILVHLCEGGLGQHLFGAHLCPFVLKQNMHLCAIADCAGNSHLKYNIHLWKSVEIFIFLDRRIANSAEYSHPKDNMYVYIFEKSVEIYTFMDKRITDCAAEYSHPKENFHIVNQFLHL